MEKDHDNRVAVAVFKRIGTGSTLKTPVPRSAAEKGQQGVTDWIESEFTSKGWTVVDCEEWNTDTISAYMMEILTANDLKAYLKSLT